MAQFLINKWLKFNLRNTVKFIKGNFANNRVFHQIEIWNEQCLAWLKRKGNYQVHNTIKKRPIEVFTLEKLHLREVSRPLSFESNHGSSITRTVHKDNIIKYQSNRYSVPLGTYKPHGDNTVYIRIDREKLIIEKTPGGVSIAVHPLSKGKGQLIKNSDHTRDKSKGIQAYMETIKVSFDSEEKIDIFLKEIHKRYPRYIRDQLQIIQRTLRDYEPYVYQALETCIIQGLWSANDLRDVAIHQANLKQKEYPILSDIQVTEAPSALIKEKASVRELDGYLRILGGA